MGHPARKINIAQFKNEQKRQIKNPSIRLISQKQKLKSKQREPKYFIYIITGDAGFAPNPFYGFCTLANCMPIIRKVAKEGDWIIGLYSQAQKIDQNLRGKLVYAMKVQEKMTFSQYWKDKRFLRKKQNTHSAKGRCGDNMYYKTSNGDWIQKTYEAHNTPGNRKMDTSVDAVLISKNFFYLGKECVAVLDRIKKSINKSWQQKGHKTLIDQLGINHKCLDEKSGRLLIKWLERKYKKKSRHGDPISYEGSNPRCGTKKPIKTNISNRVQKIC